MSMFIPGTNNPYEFQTHLTSGVGSYADIRYIYTKAFKTFSDNLPSGNDILSNMDKNIKLLSSNEDYSIIKLESETDDNVKLFNQNLTKNIVLDNEYSALSVNLNLGEHSITTNENTVLIL